MIALPWLQEARQDDPNYLKCDDCMANTDTNIRAAMNCGWIPASAHTDESPPIIPDGTPITVCPGYTTTLPDVIDVTHQFNHWENGSLGHVCPDGVPKPLLVGLTVFKNAGEARSAYRMREADAARKRGAGG